jgi:carbamoyl-phosphate synthase large subunit
MAKAAARVAVGQTIAQLREARMLPAQGDGADFPTGAPIAVKEAVLPFGRFHGVDTVLGPEMKSTGEVMGIDSTFGVAFAKSQLAASSQGLPTSGRVFVSIADRDKRSMIFPIKRLADLGFELYATSGTAQVLRRNGVTCHLVRKQSEGPGPHGEKTVVQMILDREIDLVVNTPHGIGTRQDGYDIRTAAVLRSVASITTVQGLAAAVQGIEAMQNNHMGVTSLQDYEKALNDIRMAGA